MLVRQDWSGFFMGVQSEDNLLPASPKEINDNATSSGNSVALRTLVRLARRTGKQHYQNYAQQLIRAYSDDITQRPYSCSYLICGLLEMFTGEQSNTQWCAEGNIHIAATSEKNNVDYNITLKINIKDSWHINQIQDNNTNAVPVKIQTVGDTNISNIQYPEAISKSLGFQSENVNVYEDEIQIKGTDEITELGKSFSKMLSSIKQIIELEKKLTLSEQKLKNERFTAIGELSARIAHDIRNPLNVIHF